MIESFLASIDASPTAHHVVDLASSKLSANGFVALDKNSSLTVGHLDKGYVINNGSIIAWKNAKTIGEHGLRIVGAHTDSPGLHIKPKPDSLSARMSQLQVEVYGGPLLNSWLDRDLAIAGHVVLLDGSQR
ncbi:MAG: hypothetical protein RL623_703, partial [Actinomycetota bacterium]